MQRKDIKIKASGGGEFDCYLATPDGAGKTPAVVIASAIHGVDDDHRAIADVFASRGFIAAAPDPFWRTVPGPLGRGDARSAPRGQPRLEKIATGEADFKDTLAELGKLPQFNGRAATMGFCYGGPYAILGPKRLGYAAGISVHGSQLGDYLKDLEGVSQPVCIIWGDLDNQAPPPVQESYCAAAARIKNLELHIFPGILHGYMLKGGGKAYDEKTYHFSMDRAFAVLEGLR